MIFIAPSTTFNFINKIIYERFSVFCTLRLYLFITDLI